LETLPLLRLSPDIETLPSAALPPSAAPHSSGLPSQWVIPAFFPHIFRKKGFSEK
jgi:hypothetical protein